MGTRLCWWTSQCNPAGALGSDIPDQQARRAIRTPWAEGVPGASERMYVEFRALGWLCAHVRSEIALHPAPEDCRAHPWGEAMTGSGVSRGDILISRVCRAGEALAQRALAAHCWPGPDCVRDKICRRCAVRPLAAAQRVRGDDHT